MYEYILERNRYRYRRNVTNMIDFCSKNERMKRVVISMTNNMALTPKLLTVTNVTLKTALRSLETKKVTILTSGIQVSESIFFFEKK
ncbi:hypothetical protein NPIL_153751 [Nephila pilipes]|uniref:Uncharacterized protein n=1 Tax=Nephila pilipes TaxID=299642 RepID=A0A8X6U7C9_NEPPI|nr:hypothetical protein NPIL_153751 [Nephila pilipes]